jgi:RimJ/RimL family protein N-acetyltransferase
MDPRNYATSDKTRDGTFVRIRAIRPDDSGRLAETFTQLSTETIRARWGGLDSGLTAGAIVEEIDIDPDVHVGLVATVWIDGEELIVGLASYFVDPWSEPRRAEVAFIVLDDWQGRGIGSLLFAHLARIALRLGVDVFYALVSASNRRMIRIFEKSGFSGMVEYDGAEAWVTLDLAGTGIVTPPAVGAYL